MATRCALTQVATSRLGGGQARAMPGGHKGGEGEHVGTACKRACSHACKGREDGRERARDARRAWWLLDVHCVKFITCNNMPCASPSSLPQCLSQSTHNILHGWGVVVEDNFQGGRKLDSGSSPLREANVVWLARTSSGWIFA